jgi:mannosyltransferase OCH1-like enzyme
MEIPKKIHFTCKDKHAIHNPVWKACLNKYYKMYSNYEIIIHDNADIYKLIETHFPQYLEKIKQIKIGAVLADIFRYLILYLEGGVYSDLDCEPIIHIDTLLSKEFTYFHGDKERDNYYYIYKDTQIINNKWDFKHNVCNNCEIINNTCNPVIMKCLGHKIATHNMSTILGYEFHSDWHDNKLTSDEKWCYKNVGICQWFIISKPKQDIFLKIFLYCMENIDTLIHLDIGSKKYHYDVINTCGPLRFTKIVLDNIENKICILPSDFFCAGPLKTAVPETKNSFVVHKFTASWLPQKV